MILRRLWSEGIDARTTHIVVDPVLLLHHAAAHVEPMEEDAGDIKGSLGELEEHSGLVDEIDTLGPAQALLGPRQAI